MKKIIYVCVVLLAFCWQSNAQFTFSPIAGPTNVAAGAPVTLDLNDAANAAGVTAGQYATFTITVDWVAGAGNPWSNEAEMQVTTSAGVADVDPPTAGGGSNGNATTLTFAAGLAGIYDPSVDGSLSITLGQSFGGSDADWSNISVTLNPFVPPTPPVTAATLNIVGCSASDSYMTAYDASVAGIVWVEVIYDGNCSALISDTETSTFDTEIGIYNSNGFLIGSNDDGGSGTLSLFTAPGLAAGTYYVAAGAFNTTFGAGFVVTTNVTTTTGNLSINLSTPAPPPECVEPTIDSATVVDSCNPDGTGTFNVEVVVSDAGDAGTVISDGTNTYPVVVGTVTAGPYNSGDTVTLTVDATDDACDASLGDFTFTCPQPAPGNDLCADADMIACGDTVSGTNVGATDSDGVAGDGCGTSSTAVGVWYAFMGTGDTVTASLCSPGTDFDTEITVYSGVCGDLTCEGNNDDDSSCEGSFESFGSPRASTFTWESQVGTTYYIYVSGFGAATGNFDLSITCVAPPACVEPTIDSATVVDSCNTDGTGTFNVEVVVSDAGDTGTVISDGTNTYPVVVGTVVAGPYNSGDTVTLTVDATDDACDSILGDFTFTCPQPAPDNDLCADAEMVACGDTVMGDTTNATSDPGQTYCGTSAPSATNGGVWYAFMGDGGEATFDLTGSSFDTKIFVYTGVCGDLTCLDGDDDGGVGTTSSITLDTMAGTTYYVYVSGFGSNRGAYTMNVTCVAPPACVEPTIDNATIVESCNPDGTGTFNVEVVVSDAGSAGTVISDGTNTYPVMIGTVVAGPYNSGDTVTLTVDATDDACDSSLGDFTFTCPEPAPVNDDCAGALLLDCGVTITASTEGATASGLDAECSGFTSSDAFDLFYTFVADGTSSYTLSLDDASGGFSFDGVMFVYSGPCDDLTSLACSDSGSPEEITLDAPSAGTYTVRIFDYFGTAAFTLDLTCVAPPECAEPTNLGPETETPTVTTFTWLPGGSETSWEFALSQPDATDPEPATVVTEPTANVGHAPGQTLLIWIRAICGDGIFSEWVTIEYTSPLEAPDNDLCADAEMVACGDTVIGDTTDATSDPGQAYCGTSAPSSTNGGVWYSFMGDGNDVTFDLTGSSFDTKIFVYTGVCGDLTCLDGDDDGGDGTTSSITVATESGTTYYVYVSGFSGNRGAYTMSVSCETPPQTPDNDLCADAQMVACGDTVSGTNIGATDGDGVAGDGCGTSGSAVGVWYAFMGNGDTVTASVCNAADFDTEITVYTGVCGDLTCLGNNDDNFGAGCSGNTSEFEFDSEVGTTYYIYVSGFGSATGNFDLSITCETPDPCAGPLPQLTWTGTMDTNWENTGNWDNNEAPGLMVFADVTIPIGAPNYPMLTVGQDLYISECSTVTVENGASLNVNPNVEVTNDGIVANDGSVTFESDATGSAYIGSGMGMFMGDFTVERYIPAKRAYRQLGTPVTTSTPISDNWQQDTHITGPAGNTDGFDVTFTGNPSAYIFDNIAYEYVVLANTNATNLIPGTMYHILIRGDRNTDLGDNDATPSETTLHATGELTAENVGSQMIAVNVPEQRFIAVGNPFQSQIDMNTVLTTGSTNINPNFYWVWDPTLGTRGAYAAIMAATGTASTAGSDANQYLQAGQAGWVYTAGAGQSSVIFDQSSKNNSGFETSTFTDNGGSTSLSQLRLSLYESSAFANNDTATDGVLILFGANGNNGIDANDALSITNLDENFATSNNGELLSIENRAMPQEIEEIQLEINTYRSTNYTIVAEGISIEGVTPYLYDDYTGTYTEIPQTGSVNYSYSVDAGITSSIANDRFTVVFFQSTLSTSSFDLDSVKLYPNPTNIGKFYLNVPLGMDDLEITIYDVLGTRLYNETGFNAGSRITVEAGSEFSMGTYFVELSSNGRTTTKKLIIN